MLCTTPKTEQSEFAKATPVKRTIQLLGIEGHPLFMNIFQGVTTVTFYEGDLTTVLGTLQGRIKEIVIANPWLAGTLTQSPDVHGNTICLTYPETVDQAVFDKVFKVRTDLKGKLDSAATFNEIMSAVNGATPYAHIPVGAELLNTDAPIALFTVFEMEHGFALVVSISHCLADGHTYYTIMDMIHDQNPVKSMTVDRKLDFEEKAVAAFGERARNWFMEKPLTMNWIAGCMCSLKGRAECFTFYVNPGRIKAAKRNFKPTSDKVKFISTNDIVTHHFANAFKGRVCMMAVNARNRVPGVGSNDAGNYESCINYSPESCATPGLIRQSILGPHEFKPVGGRALPGTWETLRARVGIITNWTSSFGGDLNFDSRCRQTLHVPFTNVDAGIPCSIGIIFNPVPGRTAVMYFAKPKVFGLKDLLAAGTPLGESVEVPDFSTPTEMFAGKAPRLDSLSAEGEEETVRVRRRMSVDL